MKEQGRPAIIEAAARADIERVTKLLGEGLVKQLLCCLLLAQKAVTVTDTEGSTALFYAARAGCLPIMQLLLEAKAKVDHRNNYGFTPLHWAAQHGKEAAVELLVEHKARVNATPCDHLAVEDGAQRKTPLFLAASRSPKKGGPAVGVVKILLKAKADPAIRPDKQVAPIHFFAQSLSEYQPIVMALLLAGAKLDLKLPMDNPLERQSLNEIYFEARSNMTLFKYKTAIPILQNKGIPTPVADLVVKYAASFREAEAYQDDAHYELLSPSLQ